MNSTLEGRAESERPELPPSPAPFPRAEKQKRPGPPEPHHEPIPTSTQTGSPPASPSAIHADPDTKSISDSPMLSEWIEHSPPAKAQAARPQLERRTPAPDAPSHPASHGLPPECHRRRRASPARAPAAEHRFV